MAFGQGALWLVIPLTGAVWGIKREPLPMLPDPLNRCACSSALPFQFAAGFHASAWPRPIGPRSPSAPTRLPAFRFSTAGAQPHASPATTEPAPAPALHGRASRQPTPLALEHLRAGRQDRRQLRRGRTSIPLMICVSSR